MFHKYRAAIGRESLRPASRGIFAYPEPRRRNCRRAISLAATKQVGQKRFLREKSRFRGPPRNAGHPFGRQGISSPVNAAGIPVGCQVFGKKALPVAGRHTCIHLQCIWPRVQMQHPPALAAAAMSFDQGARRPGVCPCGPSAQTPFFPAPSEKRRRRFSTAPIRLGENPFLLIQQECARPVFTLT